MKILHPKKHSIPYGYLCIRRTLLGPQNARNEQSVDEEERQTSSWLWTFFYGQPQPNHEQTNEKFS